MNILSVLNHAGRTLFRQAVAIIITGIMMLQPLIAEDSWSRIEKLKPRTWIYIHYSDEKYMEGSFLRADASGMIIRAINQDEVKLDRDLILQVTVMNTSRHWYSIPLAIATGVAGGFGGHAITDQISCSRNVGSCNKEKGLIIGGLAVGSGTIVYGLTRGKKTDKKVIYRKD